MPRPVTREDSGSPPVPRWRVGPAGWSYADWKGIVYPPYAGRGFDALRWIGRFFDLVEINVSFYRVPPPRTAASWVERTADLDLGFTAKLPRSFTHGGEATSAGALTAFSEFLLPLEEAGRLDAVLAQFPWSVRPSESSLERLARVQEELAPRLTLFEVRHADWARPVWTRRLDELGIETVHVDQPLLRGNLGSDAGSARHVYVRLHGRNARSWFDREAGRDQRYDYLYTTDELQQWAEKLRPHLATARSVHVVTNNHFEGQAVVNALELMHLLGRTPAEAPAKLRDRFTDLEERWAAVGMHPRWVDAREDDPDASTSGSSTQGELF